MASRTASPVPQREYHGDGYSVAASFAPIDGTWAFACASCRKGLAGAHRASRRCVKSVSFTPVSRPIRQLKQSSLRCQERTLAIRVSALRIESSPPRRISSASLASFSLSRVVFVTSASDGSRRSAVSSCLR